MIGDAAGALRRQPRGNERDDAATATSRAGSNDKAACEQAAFEW